MIDFVFILFLYMIFITGEADPPELEATEFIPKEAFPTEDEGVGE